MNKCLRKSWKDHLHNGLMILLCYTNIPLRETFILIPNFLRNYPHLNHQVNSLFHFIKQFLCNPLRISSQTLIIHPIRQKNTTHPIIRNFKLKKPIYLPSWRSTLVDIDAEQNREKNRHPETLARPWTFYRRATNAWRNLKLQWERRMWSRSRRRRRDKWTISQMGNRRPWRIRWYWWPEPAVRWWDLLCKRKYRHLVIGRRCTCGLRTRESHFGHGNEELKHASV